MLIRDCDGTDDIALAASAMFTTVALMGILYTAYKYTWRVFKIRFDALLCVENQCRTD